MSNRVYQIQAFLRGELVMLQQGVMPLDPDERHAELSRARDQLTQELRDTGRDYDDVRAAFEDALIAPQEGWITSRGIYAVDA